MAEAVIHQPIAPAVKIIIGHITWCCCVNVLQAGDWCPDCGTMVVAR